MARSLNQIKTRIFRIRNLVAISQRVISAREGKEKRARVSRVYVYTVNFYTRRV